MKYSDVSPRRTEPFALILIVVCLVHVASAQVNLDFTANNGSLTTNGIWGYNGAWYVEGQLLGASASLTTPTYTVMSDGIVSGSLTHRFSFETRGDGGQIQYRLGTGAWNTIPQDKITGTTYNALLDLASGSTIRDQYAFTGESINYSSGYITSSFTLGSGTSPFQTGSAVNFVTGDQVQFQFLAAWDASSVWQTPNWQLTALSVNNVSAVPEPTTYAILSGLATLGVAAFRRSHRKPCRTS